VPVHLNHTIVPARDREASAAQLAEILGVGPPKPFGPFLVVEVDNGVSLDYIQVRPEDELPNLHYAFLVSEPEFDEIFGRIQARGLEFWADPHGNEPGQINELWGGRGVYWDDPSGHRLEIITVPYGGWPD
jgi:catechol 2,3-dioxygenase-like lactoylglutathione lyase family enzyme